ncbi:MAG: hypothetical protein FJ088_00695, partial [Deltaproteobacteria bacterium]|nr:hypothetical protein [Deltaproteobacteria bacterium]
MLRKILRTSYKILLFTLIFFYYFASRTILYFLFLFSAVHFAANSSHFRLALENMLRSIVPGSFKFEKIQIAPYLFNTDILGVSVSLPDGREIITAGYIGTNVNLVKFLNFGREILFSDKKGGILEVDLKRIDLHDFKADLEFDEKGEFVFLAAFVPPETGEPEPGAAEEEPSVKVKVSLNNIEGFRGSAVVRFPGWGISVEGISLKSKVAIKENGGVEVTAREVRFGGGGFFFKPLEEAEFPLPLNVPFGESKVEDFRLDDDRFTFGKADVLISKSRITAAGGMAFPADAELSFTGGAVLEIPPEEPLLYRLANLSVISPVKAELHGAGTFSDIAARVKISADSLGFDGIPFSGVVFDASIQKEGDEKSPARGKYRVDMAKFAFSSNAGEFNLKDTVIYPFGDAGDRELIFKGRFDFSNLLLPALLKTAFKINKGDNIPVSTLEGAVDFKGEIAGKGEERKVNIETGFGIDGNVRKELSYFDGNKVRLKGNLSLEKPLKGGVSKLTVSNFSFSSGRDSLTFKGLIIPEDKSIYGRFYIRKFLEPLTSRLASVAVPAEIIVDNGSISGSLLDPSASGYLYVRELSFSGFEVSSAEAKIALKDWILEFDGLKGSTNMGDFSSDGSIMLFEQGDLANPVLTLKADNFTVENLRLEKITGGDLKGEFSLKGRSIAASLSRFVETFSGSFGISSPHLEYKEFKFSEFTSAVVLTGERLSVGSFSIKSEKSGTISGKFATGRDFKQSDLKISLVDLNLGILFE